LSNPGTIRPGGRTARTRAAVFDATLTELASSGYDQVSMEAIALRAGVHKTTVYRRWRSKDQLVAEALEAGAQSWIDVPDTGDLDHDLRTLARAVRTLLTSRVGAATVRALVSGAQASPAVEQILRNFWAIRLARVASIVERAIARGELSPATDSAELMKHLAAPLFHRVLVTAEPVTEAAADRAAAAALAAARAGVFAST
jgi:AcrR family transcriptional regulator